MSDGAGAATDVVAVVVTWNRRDLLVECLAALRAQTLPPTHLVVVDNASTDGTAELLAAEPGLEVVTLSANTGGAGGFAAGIELALTFGPDLVWLLDDDTVPTGTAAERLATAWSSYAGERPAVLASRVVWTDGRDHPRNTPRSRREAPARHGGGSGGPAARLPAAGHPGRGLARGGVEPLPAGFRTVFMSPPSAREPSCAAPPPSP